jgi:hypothetical protein
MSRRADLFRVSVVPPRAGEGPDWYWRIRPPHGKKGETRRSSKTTDRAAAEEGAKRVAERLNRGIVQPGGDPPVIDVLKRFYDAREAAMAPRGTLKSIRTAMRWVAPLIGSIPASKITTAIVLGCRDALVRHGLAGSTLNRGVVGVMRSAWAWAKARELVPSDFPHVADLDEIPTQKRPLYPEEVRAIIEQVEVFAGGRWLPLFRALYESGHRVGALLEALGRDLHDGPKPWIDVVDQKSGARKRALILPETAAMLKRTAPTARLFPGRGLNGQIAVSSVNEVFHRALRLAGLEAVEGQVDVHSFRRFVVDQNCQDGESIARGMRITGHTTPDIFLRYQANSRDNPHDSVRRAHERVFSTPGATPGDRPGNAASSASAEAGSPGCGSPTEPEAEHFERGEHATCGRNQVNPPRVPPRDAKDQARGLLVKLGRSRVARVIAGMLLELPEEQRDALIAVACSTGLQRGVKDAAADRGWLSREHAVNHARSARRRAARATSMHAPAAEPSPARRTGG